jgi:hypothetical protein
MWFVLGLLCFAGIAWLLVHQRWNVDWRGNASGSGRFKRYVNKGRLVTLRIGMATPSELDFELKRENWCDRLANRLGISQEPQVGAPGFDEQVYIISDDTRLTALLRQDRELLARVQALVGTSARGFLFKRLVCRRGQLWVNLKPQGKDVDEAGEIQWALDELQALSEALPALPAWKQRGVDRRFLHTLVVLGISGALSINGMLQLFRMLVMHFPYTMDVAQLWSYALLAAFAIVGALLFATVLLLGRSARMHLVLGEVLLFGSFGAVCTAFTELRDFNMEADRGPPAELDATVLEKHFSRGSKSTTYYLDISDWTGRGGSQRIEVSQSDYERFTMSMPVRVRQWPGSLGVRWVESIEPR